MDARPSQPDVSCQTQVISNVVCSCVCKQCRCFKFTMGLFLHIWGKNVRRRALWIYTVSFKVIDTNKMLLLPSIVGRIHCQPVRWERLFWFWSGTRNHLVHFIRTIQPFDIFYLINLIERWREIEISNVKLRARANCNGRMRIIWIT